MRCCTVVKDENVFALNSSLIFCTTGHFVRVLRNGTYCNSNENASSESHESQLSSAKASLMLHNTAVLGVTRIIASP